MSAAATKSNRKEQAEKLQAGIAAQVEKMASSEGWKQYLDYASSFHNYSFQNVMLIQSQRPTATRVAGFNQWIERGRVVRKGEKAIKIFGFAQKKITSKDLVTGEEVEKRVTWFPILSVFAEDQTDSFDGDEMKVRNRTIKVTKREVEHPARLLEGEDELGIADRIQRHVESLGWTFTYESIEGGANGYATLDGSRRIVVEESLSPAARAKTAAHELFHLLMHADVETGRPSEDAPEARALLELEAESAAYVLAGVLGMDTSDYSIGYALSWSGGNTDLVRSTAERVLKAVNKVLGDVFPVSEAAPVAA